MLEPGGDDSHGADRDAAETSGRNYRGSLQTLSLRQPQARLFAMICASITLSAGASIGDESG